MEKSLYNLTGAHIGDLSQIRFIDGIDDEYMADVDDDSLRAELDSDSDNDGLLDGEDPEPYKPNWFNETNDSLNINELPKDVTLYALSQLKVNDGITCNNPSNQTFYCSYASEDTKSDYGMIVGANASAAYL